MITFKAEYVSQHITRIITPFHVCVYLVEGEKKAALIDTGFGVGDLKSYVETLTDKPYSVLLSHGHVDHASGAGQFDEVYLNLRDWDLEKRHCTMEYRIWNIENGPGNSLEPVAITDYIPVYKGKYLNIDEGMDIDLGEVTIKPVAVPGHTQGTLFFVIPEDRIAIFGDGCGEHTAVLLEESTTIKEYRNSLIHLQKYQNMYDTVLRNHGTYTSAKQILEDTIELCGDIIDRKDAKVPRNFIDIPGYMGRPEEHPGKYGNIIYSMEKID